MARADDKKQGALTRIWDCVEEWIKRRAIDAIAILDWAVGAAERVVVLSITFGVFFVAWQAFWGHDESVILKALSANWQGLLLLLIPLFYRSIRAFLDRVEEAWGVKARSTVKSTDPDKPGEENESESNKPEEHENTISSKSGEEGD